MLGVGHHTRLRLRLGTAPAHKEFQPHLLPPDNEHEFSRGRSPLPPRRPSLGCQLSFNARLVQRPQPDDMLAADARRRVTISVGHVTLQPQSRATTIQRRCVSRLILGQRPDPGPITTNGLIVQGALAKFHQVFGLRRVKSVRVRTLATSDSITDTPSLDACTSSTRSNAAEETIETQTPVKRGRERPEKAQVPSAFPPNSTRLPTEHIPKKKLPMAVVKQWYPEFDSTLPPNVKEDPRVFLKWAVENWTHEPGPPGAPWAMRASYRRHKEFPDVFSYSGYVRRKYWGTEMTLGDDGKPLLTKRQIETLYAKMFLPTVDEVKYWYPEVSKDLIDPADVDPKVFLKWAVDNWRSLPGPQGAPVPMTAAYRRHKAFPDVFNYRGRVKAKYWGSEMTLGDDGKPLLKETHRKLLYPGMYQPRVDEVKYWYPEVPHDWTGRGDEDPRTFLKWAADNWCTLRGPEGAPVPMSAAYRRHKAFPDVFDYKGRVKAKYWGTEMTLGDDGKPILTKKQITTLYTHMFEPNTDELKYWYPEFSKISIEQADVDPKVFLKWAVDNWATLPGPEGAPSSMSAAYRRHKEFPDVFNYEGRVKAKYYGTEMTVDDDGKPLLTDEQRQRLYYNLYKPQYDELKYWYPEVPRDLIDRADVDPKVFLKWAVENWRSLPGPEGAPVPMTAAYRRHEAFPDVFDYRGRVKAKYWGTEITLGDDGKPLLKEEKHRKFLYAGMYQLRVDKLKYWYPEVPDDSIDRADVDPKVFLKWAVDNWRSLPGPEGSPEPMSAAYRRHKAYPDVFTYEGRVKAKYYGTEMTVDDDGKPLLTDEQRRNLYYNLYQKISRQEGKNDWRR